MSAKEQTMIKEYENLNEQDKKLVERFIEELLKKEKYEHLRKEIQKRRQEIKEKKTFSHDEIWNV